MTLNLLNLVIRSIKTMKKIKNITTLSQEKEGDLIIFFSIKDMDLYAEKAPTNKVAPKKISSFQNKLNLEIKKS